MYLSYSLSYRDIEEMMLERGIEVNHSTINRWVIQYAPLLENEFRKNHKRKIGNSWRMDETYIKIKGDWHYLYRAIDKTGQTLDWMLSRHRNAKAAKRFFRKILGNSHVKIPRVINVDKNPAFPHALQELQKQRTFSNKIRLRQVKYLNNSIENDHKSIKRKSRYRQCTNLSKQQNVLWMVWKLCV